MKYGIHIQMLVIQQETHIGILHTYTMKLNLIHAIYKIMKIPRCFFYLQFSVPHSGSCLFKRKTLQATLLQELSFCYICDYFVCFHIIHHVASSCFYWPGSSDSVCTISVAYNYAHHCSCQCPCVYHGGGVSGSVGKMLLVLGPGM